MTATQTDKGNTMIDRADRYANLLFETIEDLKAEAAAMQTFGEMKQLEEKIDDELEHIRKSIKSSDGDVRTATRQVVADLARFVSNVRRFDIAFAEMCSSVDMHALFLDRRLATRNAERWMRDELKAGKSEILKIERELFAWAAEAGRLLDAR